MGSINVLYSDHDADHLRMDVDKTELTADGHSVAFVDLMLEDKHDIRYMLEDRKVSWYIEGAPCKVIIDNGNAWSTLPFDAPEMPMHNGHIMLIVQSGHVPGTAALHVQVEGFESRTVTFKFI